MNLTHAQARIWTPEGIARERALARTTHLGIGAHQDDLEIMAFHGIAHCYGRDDAHFTGVTCTDGGGSPRGGVYARYTDEEMIALRHREQEEAAALGRYSAMIQLYHPSTAVKDPFSAVLQNDLEAVLRETRPEVVYTHNPADKHATHVGVFVNAVRAMRAMPAAERPRTAFGCEVWRGLDWLAKEDKVPLDVGTKEDLGKALIEVFDSQIAGGKRYDLAALGRRRANATYLESHRIDGPEQVWFAMDLSPLVRDETLDLSGFVRGLLDRFGRSVIEPLERLQEWT